MKKIDLHIHTIANKLKNEEEFEFSIDDLINYINHNKLNIIAITNHNYFDNVQYEDIVRRVSMSCDCVVLPGMELNIESAHMLIISSEKTYDDLVAFSEKLENRILDSSDSIDYNELVEMFPNYRKCILIPHLYKRPEIKESTLKKFGNIIKTGEVKSPKIFERTKKEKDGLVPVIFSDTRIKKDMLNFPVNNTYIDIEKYDFNALKLVLEDKNRVFISHNKDNTQFDITNDGLTASNNLNVIIGERSSGKTYTLNNIYNSYKSSADIIYVKQFQLTGNSQEEVFDKNLIADNEKISSDDLRDIRLIIERLIDVDENYDKRIDNYLVSLKEYAYKSQLDDIFSKTKIFNEDEFTIIDDTSSKVLIESIERILDSKKYKNIISKYIDVSKLKELLKEMIAIYRANYLNYSLHKEVNGIVSGIKKELSNKSSKSSIDIINLYNIFKYDILVNKFNRLCNHLKNDNVIYSNRIMSHFNIKVRRRAMKNVSEVKKHLKTSISISECFKLYGKPFNYIIELKKTGVQSDDLYKALFVYDYEITNERGNSLSGGEKAEYNLLKQIDDASSHDMLLIDEPEASFDNMFIKRFIIGQIKEISKSIPVIVSTHNSSLGMLLKPKKFIYTVNKDDKFGVYSCELGQKEFVNSNGESVESFDIIMNIMEAGEQAYKEKEKIYENFKN